MAIYRTAQELLDAYTSCLSKGGCQLRVSHTVEVGAQFVLVMQVDNGMLPIEVGASVVHVSPAPGSPGQFDILVQYSEGPAQPDALEAMLNRMMIDPRYDDKRRHPRVPVNLVAHDAKSRQRYLLTDISVGGFGLAMAHGLELPTHAAVGGAVALLIRLHSGAAVRLNGRIVDTVPQNPPARARLSVEFADLSGTNTLLTLGGMIRLHRPQSVEVTFSSGPEPVVAVREPPPMQTALPNSTALVELGSFLLAHIGRDQTQAEKPLVMSSEPPTRWPAPAYLVRVGLLGDLEGELLLQVDSPIALRIAKRVLGEEPKSPEVVTDALGEFLSNLGGRLCDRFEKSGQLIDITPPIPDNVALTTSRNNWTCVRLVAGEGAFELALRAIQKVTERLTLPFFDPTTGA